jgi:hypothetical protein
VQVDEAGRIVADAKTARPANRASSPAVTVATAAWRSSTPPPRATPPARRIDAGLRDGRLRRG